MKRLGCADRLEAYFKARPMVWIDGLELGRSGGGAYGWRSRLTDLRRRGMDIQNKPVYYVTTEGEQKKRSLYRYVPAVPKAEEQGHDLNAGFSLR